MSSSCRFCEIKNINYKNIFDVRNSEIIEKLRACTNILLEKDDLLPHFICENCENELNAAFIFRRKCEETDAKLRRELQLIKDPIKEEINVEHEKLVEIKVIDTKLIIKEENEEQKTCCHPQLEIENINSKIIEHNVNIINKPKTEEELPITKCKLSNKYQCETCELILKTRRDYILHIRSHGKQRFQCEICNHWCPSKTRLKIHMDEVHNRNGGSICELCGKKYSNPGSLNRHIADFHEQRKSYKCSSCDQIFARPYNLNQHYSAVHSTVRNWVCDECQMSFKLKAYLTIHKKQKHLPEKKNKITLKKNHKQVICPECGKSYQSNCALKDHLRLHTGEKPFQCTVCEKAFTKKCLLKQHEVIHKEFKPHKCDVCQMTFRLSHHLRTHKLIHTGEKPHQCDVCDRSFAHKCSLTAHQKSHLGLKRRKPKKNDINT